MMVLIKTHKAYFIAPILIVTIILAFFAYYIGPAILTTFIYAGI